MKRWKLHLRVIAGIAVLATVYQFFLRYQSEEIGPYDLRYDRLTSRVCIRFALEDSPEWEILEDVDSFRQGKLIVTGMYLKELMRESRILDQVEDIQSGIEEINDKVDGLTIQISFIESLR